MANIYDYLEWRGDVTFDMRPFNDVDNLVLSILVYLDFSGVVPSEDQGGSVSLGDACRSLLQKGGGDVAPFVRSVTGMDTQLVRLAAESQRFGDVRLSAYADIVDPARALQFAAIQYDLPHAGTYVAFRGTDSTLVGWRENLMTSFRITAAQEEAARYLERAIIRADAPEHEASIMVGGHSKGANLAEYAAASCSDHLRQRVTCVYSNDGPGMAPEVMPQSPRQILKDKLRLIVPVYSVIGMIFARTDEKRMVVASTASGIDQHDMATWQVRRDGMQEVDELSPDCQQLNKSLAAWVDGIPLDERERVTNEVFDALQAGGASTFNQVGATPEAMQQVVRALGTTDERTRKLAIDLIQRTIDSSVGAMRNATKHAFEDAVGRLLGARPQRVGVVPTRRGRPKIKVYIES